VYETFIAKTPDWIESNDYYHNLAPGKYTVEVLTIDGGSGIIVARTNISIVDLDLQLETIGKEVMKNCSRLLGGPVVDVNGRSRDSKIAECVGNITAEFRNPGACRLVYTLFNMTIFGQEDCIRAYAIATGDISACDITGMPKTRGFCKAKATKDWTECRKVSCDISCGSESLETQQDLCIQWYAIENRNTALCNEIKSMEYDMKAICLNITARK